jgi:hypothetical protein
VLAFGAAPVKTAVPAGPNPAGTCGSLIGAGDEKHRGISLRLRGRIEADLGLHCLARLANWLKQSDQQVARRRLPSGPTVAIIGLDR